MNNKTESPTPPGSGFVGIALVALCLIGLASAFSAAMALNQPTPDFVGGGIMLIASALSFGQLLNGLLRK